MLGANDAIVTTTAYAAELLADEEDELDEEGSDVSKRPLSYDVSKGYGDLRVQLCAHAGQHPDLAGGYAGGVPRRRRGGVEHPSVRS